MHGLGLFLLIVYGLGMLNAYLNIRVWIADNRITNLDTQGGDITHNEIYHLFWSLVIVMLASIAIIGFLLWR